LLGYDIGDIIPWMTVQALLESLLISYQFMIFMSRAKYSETGALLDSGNDLNMEGGIAE